MFVVDVLVSLRRRMFYHWYCLYNARCRLLSTSL